MIRRIRTPEDVLRTEKCDIYILNFREKDRRKKQHTWNEMEHWIRQHLPDTQIETLGPSANSIYVEGGPLTMRLVFSKSDLRKFCEQWEDDKGVTLDPRFQCYLLSYDDWISELVS